LLNLFKDSKEINDIVQTQISEYHYKQLEKWKAIYAGYFEEWYKLKYVTISGTKNRRRQSLHMAKIACAEMAKLIFSENVEINISDETLDDNIKDLLKKNRFDKVFQDKVEVMLAMGGLAIKAFPKEQPDGTTKLLISYVTPDCFIPMTWENEEITEAAFLTITRKEDKLFCLFEIHKWNYTTKDGQATKVLTIENKLFVKDARDTSNSGLKQINLSTLYPDLSDSVNIEGLTRPLFVYAKPAIANNFDLQSPLGISVFANALDTLYAIDVAFDSFVREFRLGKRRIIVPAQAVRTVIDPTSGEMHRYFDADDEVYQAMHFTDPEKAKPIDATVPLRVDEHVAALNALLNLYSMQLGFSSGSFTFDGTQVKTATEVIMENSKTFQTMKANEHILEEALENFIHTLAEVASLYDLFDQPEDDWEVKFNWDDSIIGDKYQDSDYYIKLLTNGLYSKKRAIMKVLRVTEEEAEEILQEIQDEESSQQPDINDVLNNNNPLNALQGDKTNTDDQQKTNDAVSGVKQAAAQKANNTKGMM
jgi:A118 family predicted phage portal protein